MTLLDAPPAPPAAEPPTRVRRGRRLLFSIAAVALVAGGVVGGVAIRDAVSLSQVHVFLDAKPFTCTDPSDVTTVARGGSGDDDTFRVPAVRGVTSLDCELAVVIENDSDLDVDVQRAVFPLLGPGSAVGLRVDRSDSQSVPPTGGADGTDTVFDYQHDGPIGVPAHDTLVLRYHLMSNGCRQQGATTSWDTAPVLTLATGLVTSDVDRQGVPFGFVGARTAVQPCS